MNVVIYIEMPDSIFYRLPGILLSQEKSLTSNDIASMSNAASCAMYVNGMSKVSCSLGTAGMAGLVSELVSVVVCGCS